MLRCKGLCLHYSIVAPCCCEKRRSFTAQRRNSVRAMDATTTVAAALAIAVNHGHAAALHQVLLDTERAAMTAEDRGSLLAQRFWTASAQVPVMRLQTWQAAHRHLNNVVQDLRYVMMLALRALYNGHVERAQALLED